MHTAVFCCRSKADQSLHQPSWPTMQARLSVDGRKTNALRAAVDDRLMLHVGTCFIKVASMKVATFIVKRSA